MNIRMVLMKILDLKRLRMKLIILQVMVMQKRVGYQLTIIGISLKIQVVWLHQIGLAHIIWIQKVR